MIRLRAREFLAGGLAASASLGRAVPLLAANQAERPLRDIAGARGIRYGSAAMASQLLTGDSFTDLLVGEVAALVPENEMKLAQSQVAPVHPYFQFA